MSGDGGNTWEFLLELFDVPVVVAVDSTQPNSISIGAFTYDWRSIAVPCC